MMSFNLRSANRGSGDVAHGERVYFTLTMRGNESGHDVSCLPGVWLAGIAVNAPSAQHIAVSLWLTGRFQNNLEAPPRDGVAA